MGCKNSVFEISRAQDIVDRIVTMLTEKGIQDETTLKMLVDIFENECQNDDERREVLDFKYDYGYSWFPEVIPYSCPSVVVYLLALERDLFAYESKTKNRLPIALDAAAASPILDVQQVINSVDSAGKTFLHRAAMSGRECKYRFSSLSWLLSNEEGKGRQSGFDSVLARDVLGKTALHRAVQYRNEHACFVLIEGCIDDKERHKLVTSVDNDGRTALHEAAQAWSPQMVEELLRYPKWGPFIDYRDKYGLTALHLAVMGQVVRFIPYSRPEYIGCRCIDIVKALLRNQKKVERGYHRNNPHELVGVDPNIGIGKIEWLIPDKR